MTRIVQSQQGDTIDMICWRNYGRRSGAVEAVFAANPGLAAFGAVLPIGTAVSLPDIAVEAPPATVSLWD